ncbi:MULTISPECIES: hypothetical protein [unclassified Oleiphilus]|nr:MULTISPECIES: hypothetical protein [unclassified Oleiphilus]
MGHSHRSKDFMIDRLSLRSLGKSAFITVAGSVFAISSSVQAEVKSLTSSELTDTYIEDSTIIITPKKQSNLSQQRTISSVTIAPYEGEDTDSELLIEQEESQTGLINAVALDEETLRNSSVDAVFIPEIEVDIPTYEEINTQPVADILGDERYRPPEGDFDFSYIGDDLALSRQGDKLTFSIGNLPGIDQINIPEAVQDGGPVELIPRPGGGFDLTINVPESQ